MSIRIPAFILLVGFFLAFVVIGQAQIITSVTPTSGEVGTQITVTGTSLLPVAFGYDHGLVVGGASVTIVSWTDTQIVAILGTGFPGNTPSVPVYTWYMSRWDDYSSNVLYWTALQAPITSISPTTGWPGTEVTIIH